jgi:hypothetical protein
MKYFGKTTSELSDKDFSELSILFNNVFTKNVDVSYFKHKYRSPLMGFSFHGLMYNDEGNIVGALTFIPFSYQYYDHKIVAGSAADLMIDEHYRKDLLSFKNMYDLAVQKAGNLFDFLYAVPNSNAYLYWTKFLKWHDIGQLNYYIQILNISKIKNKFRSFDLISNTFSNFLNRLVFDFGRTANEIKFSIFKVNDGDYYNYRFKDQYAELCESDKKAYYTIVDELGTKAAYIIDLLPFSTNWIRKVVKLIYARERGNIDIIIYIGNNLRSQINLFKVPGKFEPRILKLIGKSLSEKVDNRLFDLKNWQFNLSNFDTR